MEPKKKKPRISPPPLYLSPAQKENHEKFYSQKKVISERYIDYESFPKYPIAQCFGGKNMITSLLHVRGEAPISPVLLFYSQIHNFSEENQSFDTYIGGKRHKITPQVIASLLELDRPLEPVCFPPANEDELVVSKTEFRRAVYLPEHVNCNGRHPKTEIKVAYLKPIVSALVKICQSNILPAFSGHYFTNLNSIYLSYLLLNGYPVDIPYVIWQNMSAVAPNSVRTKAVPYGILVGRLLCHLGQSFPADTPCTTVPADFDVKLLRRNHLPYDPCDSDGRHLSEPDSDYISPPPPPSTDDDGASELPPTLPNDPPREFVRLSDSFQSLKDTVEVILSHIVTRQDRFEKQQQEMMDRVAREDDRREQQHQEFMRQKKMIERIAHQQERLQKQHEEFGRQQKLITDGIVTRQDHFEQQLQEIIDRNARQDDRIEQQQKEMIDRIASRDDRLELQLQEMIDRIASQDDRLEQQHEEFMQQKKMIEQIAHQQHHLQQQHEEFSQQKKLIDQIITQGDRFEQQQQEIIARIAREDDYREQQLTKFAQLRKLSEHIASQQDWLELRLEEVKQQHETIDHFVTHQDCCEQQSRDTPSVPDKSSKDGIPCNGKDLQCEDDNRDTISYPGKSVDDGILFCTHAAKPQISCDSQTDEDDLGTDCSRSEYEKKLEKCINMPFDDKEFTDKWELASRCKELDQHPALKEMVDRALACFDGSRVLLLLRCLFFYNENMAHKGAFMPWKDPSFERMSLDPVEKIIPQKVQVSC